MADDLRLALADYGRGEFFATRRLGELVREDAEQILDGHPGEHLTLDFTGVVAITVTFADELVANLCATYGSRILVAGIDDEIANAIEIALSRRNQKIAGDEKGTLRP